MQRALLAFVLTFAAFFACTSSLPSVPAASDPAVPDGATKAVTPPPAVLPPPGTRCGPPDTSPPKTGPTFCDLPGVDAPEITVPEGFCVRELTTTPVPETRVLRFAPNGDLFVSAPSQPTPGGAGSGLGAIFVLPDDDHDGRADAIVKYAGGPTMVTDCATSEKDPADLSCVHGMAFANGYLYYTRSDEVRRFPYASGDRTAKTPAGELVATLGGAALGARWTHTLDVRDDGHLLVSRGRHDGVRCSAAEMAIGAIFSIDPAAPMPAKPALVSDGFRNPMYVRCRPGCGDCFANELSGDGWGGIGGHEKLVAVQADTHWGFPCCVARNNPVPGQSSDVCNNLGSENVVVPLHDTPFGLDFENGKFPAPYTYGVFSALHGSVGSWKGTAVSWAPTDPVTHAPTGTFQVFATGWGQNGALKGRATDVTFAPDGRMFVGDDETGRIFWIAPRGLVRP